MYSKTTYIRVIDNINVQATELLKLKIVEIESLKLNRWNWIVEIESLKLNHWNWIVEIESLNLNRWNWIVEIESLKLNRWNWIVEIESLKLNRWNWIVEFESLKLNRWNWIVEIESVKPASLMWASFINVGPHSWPTLLLAGKISNNAHERDGFCVGYKRNFKNMPPYLAK